MNTGALSKNGTGTLRLAGTATHGGTSVLQGTLIVNGTHLPAVALQAGTTLGGNGTVGTLAAEAAETLAPSDGGPGILHASAVTFETGSQFVVQLNGPAPGTGYDRLDVSGTTTLNTPTLTVQLGYTPAPGQAFLIATT